ncbi:MAG: hypothetical protein RR673_03870 [Erysipelotrichaceae bacterium]
MSKKASIELRDLNNESEKKMSKESNLIYTDMIVYLRVSRLSLLQQEEVRKDLIDMIVDGEARGESIEQIIGKDYKAVCDEIINNFPPVSLKDKFVSYLSIGLLLINILLGISIVNEFIVNLIKKRSIFQYDFKSSQLFMMIVICLVSIMIVTWVGKSALNDNHQEKTKKERWLSFFKWWIILFIIIAVMLFIMMQLNQVLFTCNIIYPIVIAGLSFISQHFIDKTSEY